MKERSFIDRGDCVHNAYAFVQNRRKEGASPKVIFVKKQNHAYVLDGNVVLNKGVTWGSDHYRDYDQEELSEMIRKGEAEDITDSLDASSESDGGRYQIGKKKFPLLTRMLRKK